MSESFDGRRGIELAIRAGHNRMTRLTHADGFHPHFRYRPIMHARIRCHVIEVPAQDHWLSRRGGRGAGELLPWADPYIASLMRRLERRCAGEDERGEGCDPFHGEGEVVSDAAFDDGWQEDAFMPRPIEPPRIHSYPPVYGRFPLLEDA
jgi:hypothetical protein